ncbi:hypothetical protein, partial [Ligilactobacillus murinus]|uniref:DUF5976 family putative bacteriocin n=3 Tax=Ligilactobacillus murinus TaxID=1622 RepID=UPI0031DBB76A
AIFLSNNIELIDIVLYYSTFYIAGIKGKKRYVIFPLLEAEGVPFGIWLVSGREVSFLHFVTTPKMLLFVALCLTFAAPLLYFLDNVMGITRKMHG